LEDEEDMGQLRSDVQVQANLTKAFQEAAIQHVVPDTPPSRQGLSSTDGKLDLFNSNLFPPVPILLSLEFTLTIFDVLMEQGLQTKLPLYTPHIPY
jgi:hypothetical protein